MHILMTVDGAAVGAFVSSRYLLSDFLREKADAGGVHVACGQGVCGACTVAVDGVPVRACLMLAVQADGARVQTIASLAALERTEEGDRILGKGEPTCDKADLTRDKAELTPLQRAFREHHALQCGYCTPGLLVSTALFLAQNPAPNRAEILDHLNGHLCRCSGYANIVTAIESVLPAKPMGQR